MRKKKQLKAPAPKTSALLEKVETERGNLLRGLALLECMRDSIEEHLDPKGPDYFLALGATIKVLHDATEALDLITLNA